MPYNIVKNSQIIRKYIDLVDECLTFSFSKFKDIEDRLNQLKSLHADSIFTSDYETVVTNKNDYAQEAESFSEKIKFLLTHPESYITSDTEEKYVTRYDEYRSVIRGKIQQKIDELEILAPEEKEKIISLENDEKKSSPEKSGIIKNHPQLTEAMKQTKDKIAAENSGDADSSESDWESDSDEAFHIAMKLKLESMRRLMGNLWTQEQHEDREEVSSDEEESVESNTDSRQFTTEPEATRQLSFESLSQGLGNYLMQSQGEAMDEFSAEETVESSELSMLHFFRNLLGTQTDAPEQAEMNHDQSTEAETQKSDVRIVRIVPIGSFGLFRPTTHPEMQPNSTAREPRVLECNPS